MPDNSNLRKLRPHIGFAASLVSSDQWDADIGQELHADLGKIQNRMEDTAVNISIIGDFSSGKSSLINAILGVHLLEMDDMPDTTLIPAILYYAPIPVLTVERRGAPAESYYIPIEDIRRKLKEFSLPEFRQGNSDEEYIRNLTLARETAEKRAEGIVQFSIGLPSDFLRRGFRLIDTPGLNSDNRRCCAITASMMNLTDASIIVVNGCQGVMLESLRNELSRALNDRLRNCMVVYTRYDLITRREKFRLYQQGATPGFFGLTPEDMPVFMAVPPAVLARQEGRSFGPEHDEMLRVTLETIEGISRHATARRDRMICDSLISLTRKIYGKLESHISKRREECRRRLEELERSRAGSLEAFAERQCQTRSREISIEAAAVREELSAALDGKICDIQQRLCDEIMFRKNMEALDSFMTIHLEPLLLQYTGEMNDIAGSAAARVTAFADRELGAFYDNLRDEFRRRNIVPVGMPREAVELSPVSIQLMDSMKEAVSFARSERKRQNTAVGLAVAGGVIGSIVTLGIGTAVGAALGAWLGSGGKKAGMDGVIPAIQSKYSQRLAEALALQKENLMKAYAEAADGILASFTGVVLGCRTRYEEAVDGMSQEEYRQQEATASALSRLEKQLEEITLHQKEIEQLWITL